MPDDRFSKKPDLDPRQIKLQPPFLPCLCSSAIEFFESILQPDFVVCEYGSGGSTVWLAQRVKQVYSIEHSRVWFEEVQRHLDTLDLDVESELFPGQNRPNDPLAERYTTFVTGFPDEFFDLVYLDGWRPSRGRAPALAKPKVKPGGWMVVDNMKWHPVHQGVKLAGLTEWHKVRFKGDQVGWIEGITLGPRNCRTSFFQRPVA